MPPRISITQRDVAILAGVSQATVSAALNDSGSLVAPETAAKISAAIAELGYRPNRFAQALKTQKSMTVACVVPDLTNPFYPSLLRAAQKVLNASNYDVVAIDTGGRASFEASAVSRAMQGRYDGIFGVFFHHRLVDFRQMLEARIPLVRVEAMDKVEGPLPLDNLFVDNRAAVSAMTERLIALGHRSIAMIAGEGGPQAMRVSGYQDALLRHNLESSVWLDPVFTEIGGCRAADRMLDSGFRPTAVVAANDLLAIGVMRALTTRGMTVPDDTSVTGFDDILAASLVVPPLTTVALRQDRIGTRVAEILLERMAGKIAGHGRTVEMPFEIVSRGSVAPPPCQTQ